MSQQRIISIASGKGGVGKTTFALNFSFALSKFNKKTCIIDADLGLANVNIILGIEPKYTLDDIIFRDVPIKKTIVNVDSNLDLIPGGSGIYRLANLDIDQRRILINKFKELGEYDFLVIDNSPGISSSVMSFCLSSREVVVIVTPEATSLADGYALIKTLKENGFHYPPLIVINKIKSTTQTKKIFNRLKGVCKKFLGVYALFLGAIPTDAGFLKEAEYKKPFLKIYPESDISRYFFLMCERLINRSNKDLFATSAEEFWKKSFVQILTRMDIKDLTIKERFNRIIEDIDEIMLSLNGSRYAKRNLKSEIARIYEKMDKLQQKVENISDRIRVGILSFDIEMRRLLNEILSNYEMSCLDISTLQYIEYADVDVIIYYNKRITSEYKKIFIEKLKYLKKPMLIIEDFLNRGLSKELLGKENIEFLKAPFKIEDIYEKVCELKQLNKKKDKGLWN